jgi:uncharacterized protein DUF4136
VRLATLIGMGSLLLATTARAQNASYDYDKTADFGALTSYAWVNGTPASDDFNHQRIMSAVDSQLGLKRVQKKTAIAEASLLVTYHVLIGSETAVSGSRIGFNRWASARVKQVPVGSLIVDLMDARTHATVWRGVVSRDLDPDASPEQREKNINKAVEKLFKHYPPAQ